MKLEAEKRKAETEVLNPSKKIRRLEIRAAALLRRAEELKAKANELIRQTL